MSCVRRPASTWATGIRRCQAAIVAAKALEVSPCTITTSGAASWIRPSMRPMTRETMSLSDCDRVITSRSWSIRTDHRSISGRTRSVCCEVITVTRSIEDRRSTSRMIGRSLISSGRVPKTSITFSRGCARDGLSPAKAGVRASLSTCDDKTCVRSVIGNRLTDAYGNSAETALYSPKHPPQLTPHRYSPHVRAPPRTCRRNRTLPKAESSTASATPVLHARKCLTGLNQSLGPVPMESIESRQTPGFDAPATTVRREFRHCSRRWPGPGVGHRGGIRHAPACAGVVFDRSGGSG